MLPPYIDILFRFVVSFYFRIAFYNIRPVMPPDKYPRLPSYTSPRRP